jgi:hypothetical protein
MSERKFAIGPESRYVFSSPRVVFDKFHVMILADEAVDKVRRELRR